MFLNPGYSEEPVFTKELSQSERELLREMYSKKKRNFLRAFAGVVALLIYLFSRSIITCLWHLLQDVRHGKSGYLLENEYFIGVILISLIPTAIIVTSLKYYRKHIGCYKKDLEHNIKLGELYEVRDKLVFPHTNQYFISINHPDFLHYEVAAATFQQLQVGSTVIIYRAPISGFVLGTFNRYTII